MKETDSSIKHRIKSYVRREGRMTPSQERALEQLWDKFGLELSGGVVNYDTLFNRKAPVVLEIGFGMGKSLLEQATLQPDEDFIGIEVHKPGVGALLSHLEKDNVNNIRIYQTDALDVLQQCIPDHSLSKVQIFFPDPWPKKRHHKRRLIQTPFLDLLCTKLKPEGILHLATDWENYAEQMMDLLTQHPTLKNQAGKGNFSPSTHRPPTKFEQRGIKLGHGVWDLIFFRV